MAEIADETFDAGTLGCADGLTGAFKERMARLAPGDRLTVVVRDPGARSDLPALARLMGHEIASAADAPDGSTAITVVRGA